ncbi:hypothetical protein CPT_Mendera_178 [Stenotrophomonas phage Mendera]|uniref:Uncharacterized protein n=1 Tax=Stenotrophomonas phage Mendera TaxID=2650877 RepID=A0A5P8PJ50_9CAUD|nr:hypothetical protein HWC60_gp237 [Stenotrophomonas phage Mendera]QFR56704.1 hypothetical protein CPT_Mendera_178 [Stenotrophomonas phage Mendera]
MAIHHYSDELLNLIIKTAQAGGPLFYVDPYGDVEEFYYDTVKEVLEHIINEGSMLQLDNFRLYMLDLDSMVSDSAEPEEEPKETQIRVRADYENGQIIIEALGKDVKICPKLLDNEKLPVKEKSGLDPDNSVFMTLNDVKSWLKKNGSRTVRGQFRNGRYQFRSPSSEGNCVVLYFEDTYGNFWASTGSIFNKRTGGAITTFKPTAIPRGENKFKVNDITFKAVVTPKDLK